MSGVRFVTREIGSLAKPSWRVKAFAGRPLEESDFVAAEEWGRRLEVEGPRSSSSNDCAAGSLRTCRK